MKKTFLAGLMAFCVCAMALTTVSCGKLEDGINNLQQQVDELKEKVSSLEEIIAAVKAQVAVVGVEETDSVIKLTLADGKTITVAKTTFEEGEDTVTITIDGEVYTLPKFVEDTASIVLGRTDFFLRYEGVKNVELTTEGIEEYYVMNEPDGWKATISENILTVTAPTKKAIEIGAAEAEGLILVHATSTEGKCKVAKLEVKAGKGLTIELGNGGELTFTNSYASEQTNMWGESMGYNFENFYIGFATDVASFQVDPAAYVNEYKNNYSFPNWDPSGMFYNNYNIEFTPYAEGTYETDVVSAKAADLYEWLQYEELPFGTTHAIWVCASDAQGMPDPETIEYVVYTHFMVDVEVSEVSHKDATLTINVAGADKYFVGLLDASFEEEGYYTFEQYMSESAPWSYIKNGYADYIEDLTLTDGENQVVKLSEVNYNENLAFGTKYYVWVMPYVEGTVYDNFNTQFLPYVFEVTTNDIQGGGTHAVTLTEETVGYDTISVNVELSEGTETVYYAWYSAEEYAEFESDDAIREALFDSYYTLTESEVVTESYLNPGETWVLATISVGTDAKYGEIVTETYTTKTITHNENITVTLESLTLADKTYTAVFNVTGAAKLAGTNLTDNPDNREYNVNTYEKYLVTKPGVYYSFNWVDVVDGKATVTFAESTYKKDYFVWGYNVDENGAVTDIQATPLIFNLAENLPAAE